MSLTDSSHLIQRGPGREGPRASDGGLSPDLDSTSAQLSSSVSSKHVGRPIPQYAPSCCGLLDHDQLPHWIQVIDSTPGWVRSYHRPPQPSVSACLASIWQWNSETINIWSHLLAFLGAVYFLYDFLTNQFFFNVRDYGFTFDDLSLMDKVVMTTFAWSSIALFAISTIFHTFICYSPRVADTLRRLDHVAAVNHIACAMYPIIYSALTCSPYRWHFMWAIAALSLLAMVLFFFADVYSVERTWIRGVVALNVALAALSALVFHGYTMGRGEMYHAMGGGWLLGMMFCNTFSFLFYVLHFPERWSPGTFDLVGHSHQLLHVASTMATVCHAYAVLTAFGYNLHRPCEPYM